MNTYNRYLNLYPTRISSYGIITLQNLYGKLLEKIVARKIVTYLEAEDTLPDNLGGYRPGKKTWNNSGTFVYYVQEGFQNELLRLISASPAGRFALSNVSVNSH